MKPFIIISDSCCDLTKELRQQYEIEYVPMHYVYDGNDYLADLDWTEEDRVKFYSLMRNGKRITTAQVALSDYIKAFEQALENGYDVLDVSISALKSEREKKDSADSGDKFAILRAKQEKLKNQRK